MHARLVLPCMMMALCAAASACQSGPSLPDEYLGQWYFTGSSGGMDGGGTGEPAVGFIVITAANVIERYADDGTRIAADRFVLTRARSIFSGQDGWVLSSQVGFGRVIQIYPDGSMAISDNVYDGYNSHYQRTRPGA